MENLCHIKTGEILFPELPVKTKELHKLRGYMGNRFKEFDLLHNHNGKTGKHIYRYPSIQFKLKRMMAEPHRGVPGIIAYKEEGIGILKRIFMETDQVTVDDRSMKIYEKHMEIKEVALGEDRQLHDYRFETPWLALNQVNYKKYCAITREEERQGLLQKILIGNIFSFCKFAGYTVKQTLMVRLKPNHTQVILKGEKHMGFKGEFVVNFLLPDSLGLGKSTSRGYGMITKI